MPESETRSEVADRNRKLPLIRWSDEDLEGYLPGLFGFGHRYGAQTYEAIHRELLRRQLVRLDRSIKSFDRASSRLGGKMLWLVVVQCVLAIVSIVLVFRH